MKANNGFDRSYLLFAALFGLFFLFFFQPFNGIGVDTTYYYSYLSSFLFDGDVDIANDCYLSTSGYGAIWDALHSIGPKGLVANRAALGSALLWLPFVLPVRIVAWILQLLMHAPPAWTADRYSAPYLFALSFGTLCYGFLTLILIYATCRFRSGRRVSALAASGVVFASPLTAYIFTYPAMSHAQSAFAVGLLVYLAFRHREFPGPSSYLLLGAALGLATLVRWQNVIAGLIPFAFWLRNGIGGGGQPARRRVLLAVAGCLVFLAIVSVQSFYWWAQQGRFLPFSRVGHFLRPASPQFGNVLFSGWHGLYYWHPLLLVATIGMLVFLVQNRTRFVAYAAIGCIALMTYINALDFYFWGGASFGSRRFCGVLPVFALGLAAVYGLFRGRAKHVPAAITAVAVTWNILLHAAYVRGMFDLYFPREIWQLRQDVIRVLGRWILTLPMGSHASAHLIVGHNFLQAAVVLFVGLFLIASVLFLTRASTFAKAEKCGSMLVCVVVGFVLLLDVAICIRSPARDQDAVLFSRVFSKRPPALDEQQTLVSRMIDDKHPNPIVYFYAVDALKDYESLPVYLDTIRRFDPKLRAKWILALPADRTDAQDRDKAVELLKRWPTAAEELYWGKIEICLKEGDSNGARRGLKRALRHNPFSCFWLRHLSNIYAARGDLSKASECRARIRRYLEAKLNTYLKIRDRYARWGSYLFNEPYAPFVKELARFYAEWNEPERALMVQEVIVQHRPHDTAIRRQIFRLKLQVGAEDIDTNTLATELDNPDTDATMFGDAANLCVQRRDLEHAIAVLQTGFRRHPKDGALGYWLRQVLREYDTDKIPFDSLLSAELNSPEYWLCVAEYLNEAGRYVEVLKIMEGVRAQRPEHPWTNFVYGSALYHLGDLPAAEAAFREAFRAAPDYATYGVFLARTLNEQGRADEALQILDQALEKSPGDKWLSEWKQRLEGARRGER